MKKIIITQMSGKSETYEIEEGDSISLSKELKVILIKRSDGSIRMILNLSGMVSFFVK